MELEERLKSLSDFERAAVEWYAERSVQTLHYVHTSCFDEIPLTEEQERAYALTDGVRMLTDVVKGYKNHLHEKGLVKDGDGADLSR